MNRFGLNRSSLNGVIYALVLATASITCSAEVTAVAIRQADALSPTSSAAYVAAQPTVTQYLVANPGGAGGLYPQVTHICASQAQAGGHAEVVAYVLRGISGQAAFNCVSNIVAVVASTMATGEAGSSASVLASATRVQAARSSAAGVCGVEIGIDPTAWRMARAIATLGTAAIRAETAIKLDGESFFTNSCYADTSAGAEVITAEVLIRKPSAILACSAQATSVGTIKQPGRANAQGSAAVVPAEPYVTAVPFSQLACSAGVSANAVRKLVPASISIASTGTLGGAALQQHKVYSAVSGGAVVVGTGVVTRCVVAAVSVGAATGATATRVLKPAAVASGLVSIAGTALRTVQASGSSESTAGMSVDAVRKLIPDNVSLGGVASMEVTAEKLFYPESGIACSATMIVDAVRVCVATTAGAGSASIAAQAMIIKVGVSSVSSAAGLVSNAVRYVMPIASIDTAASMDVSATRRLLPTGTIVGASGVSASGVVNKVPVLVVDCRASIDASILMMAIGVASCSGTATIYADTVCNPAAYDPPERTFYRVAQIADFMHPFIETEFRRAA